MKFLSILALISTAAHADSMKPETIFDLGSQFLDRQQAAGKIDYLLNPIFCNSERDGSLALIFSVDFRHKEEAYLIENGSTARKVRTSTLGLKRRTHESSNRDFYIETVELGREKLLCVSSQMQLETPRF